MSKEQAKKSSEMIKRELLSMRLENVYETEFKRGGGKCKPTK